MNGFITKFLSNFSHEYLFQDPVLERQFRKESEANLRNHNLKFWSFNMAFAFFLLNTELM